MSSFVASDDEVPFKDGEEEALDEVEDAYDNFSY
jgi:hypothetical protein